MKNQSQLNSSNPHRVARVSLSSILSIGLLVLGGAQRSSAGVVPPDQRVAGKSYAEWTGAWLQWSLSIPWDTRHPLRDTTGANASRGQDGPVWFLGSGMVPLATTRKIVVTDDIWLFVSVGGVNCSTAEPAYRNSDEAELIACVEGNHIQELACEIDGVLAEDLEKYQFTSPMFSMALPNPNMLGASSGTAWKFVNAGVSVILEPLSPGAHTIYFHSNYAEDPAHSVSNMSYELTVVSRPALSIRPLTATGQVEISWRETAGFSLQQTDGLTSKAAWAAAIVDSSKLENGLRVVVANTASTQSFYRLALR